VKLSECKSMCVLDRRCMSINHDGNSDLPGLCIFNVASDPAHWSSNLDIFPAFQANAGARRADSSGIWCAQGQGLQLEQSGRGLNYYRPKLCADTSANILDLQSGRHVLRTVAKTLGLPPSSRAYLEVIVTEFDVSTYAGTSAHGHNDGFGTSASYSDPAGIAISGSSALFLAERSHNRIRMIDSVTAESKTLTLQESAINAPSKLAVSNDGFQLFVVDHTVSADSGGARIQHLRIDQGQQVYLIDTLAGSPQGFAGHQDGVGTDALFHGIQGIAFWDAGVGSSVYVTCYKSHSIRRVHVNSRQVTTVVGSGEETVFGHVDGVGTLALLEHPWSLAISPNGQLLYVSELQGSHIRKVTLANLPSVTTIRAIGGDGMVRLFNGKLELAMAPDGGVLWVGDNGNFSVVAVSVPSGVLLEKYGNGSRAHVDGMSQSSCFMGFSQLAVARDGSALFTIDDQSPTVRSIFVGRAKTPELFDPPSGRYFVPSTAVR
jgi:DNA-binding beta-propeller fold protein YncE